MFDVVVDSLSARRGENSEVKLDKLLEGGGEKAIIFLDLQSILVLACALLALEVVHAWCVCESLKVITSVCEIINYKVPGIYQAFIV